MRVNLENTRERALPDTRGQSLEDHLVYLKHMALYRYAGELCERKSVLDLGCGEGYGAAALASAARWVVAADYSTEAATHAALRYGCENLALVVCDAQQLPFRSHAFERVVSFEVIEHLPSVSRYLEEIKRSSVENGICLVSTPNRSLRLLPFQKPWNRFHLREYDHGGISKALGDVFRHVRVRGVTAIPEILEIEKRRVKQNPIRAYARMAAQLLLPPSIYDRVKPRAPAAPAGPAFDVEASPYSADDFTLSEYDLRDCITLVAVCSEEPL